MSVPLPAVISSVCVRPFKDCLPKEVLFRTNLYKNARPNIYLLFSVLCVLCIFSGILGVAYLGFDPLVRSLVLQRLVLSNNSEAWHIWEDPPVSPHLKVKCSKMEIRKVNNVLQVYFFNLTNPEAVFEGREKPKLDEVSN